MSAKANTFWNRFWSDDTRTGIDVIIRAAFPVLAIIGIGGDLSKDEVLYITAFINLLMTGIWRLFKNGQEAGPDEPPNVRLPRKRRG